MGSNLCLSRVAFDEPARRLALAILPFPVHQFEDYRDAAAAIARSAADAVLVVEDADAVTNMAAFSRLMMATRKPVMFNADVFIEGEGWGLMAYGVSLRQQYRRAADLAARLLEGAKPSAMPVEFPDALRACGQPSGGRRIRDRAAARVPARADRVIR